jgi:hypothetical protein
LDKNGEEICMSYNIFMYLPTKYIIIMRNFIPNKKEHVSNYFKVIDSEVKAYILGYIVADDSIGDKHFSMVCNSPKFAEQIKNKFLEVIPELKWVIYKETRKTTPYWSLHFSFNIKVRKPIYDYLYNNATVFLKRKRDKALNAVLNAVDKRTAQCRA